MAGAKQYIVSGAAVVLGLKAGSERYLYKNAVVSGEGFTKESIEHALTIGLIAEHEAPAEEVTADDKAAADKKAADEAAAKKAADDKAAADKKAADEAAAKKAADDKAAADKAAADAAKK